MKKPRRRKSWREYDPETRYYWRLGTLRAKTRPDFSNVFCRLNNRRAARYFASDFEEAGYPMAIPGRYYLREGWQDMHSWCAANFRNERGVTYTWTGEKFWFQDEEDRRRFVEEFGEGERS